MNRFSSTFLLSLLFLLPVCASERKKMVRIDRTFTFQDPNSIVLLSPEERSKRNTEFEEKPNELRYDEKEGIYIYTYWLQTGEKVEAKYDPANKVDANIFCTVGIETSTELYTYRYCVRNLPESKQAIRRIILDVDPDTIVKGDAPKGWEYFSPLIRQFKKAKWAHFGSLASDIPVDGDSTFGIKSGLGPVLADCYLSGRAKLFPSNQGEIGAFCEAHSNEEGVRGKTLGPGRVDTRKEVADHVRDDLAAALEWGWLDADAHQSLAEKYLRGKPIDKTRLKKLVLETRALGRAKRAEPELTALLEYLGWSYFHERY